jgi:hypothetical protein
MPSGGFRPGAGRPRKNPVDKKLEGKQPVKTGTAVKQKKIKTDNVMENYFQTALKECAGEVPGVDALQGELDAYIEAMHCTGYVPPQLITDYVIHRQGFLACECMNRKIGRMTKDMKLSPYVTAGQGYYKMMRDDFNLILQIVQRRSTEPQEEENEFLKLLRNRGF